MRAIPFEYCGWNKSGLQAMSSGFCNLFDAVSIRTIEDIYELLEDDDKKALKKSYEELVNHGREFELTIHVKATGKTVKLSGKRGAFADATALFNVIWAFDVTRYTTQIAEAAKALGTLKDNEKKFKTAFDTLPMPVWIRNAEYDIVWVNDAYKNASGETNSSKIIEQQKELPLTSTDLGENRSLRILAQRAVAQARTQTQSGYLVMDGKRSRVEIQEIPTNKDYIIGCAVDVSRVDELESDMRRFQDSNFEVLEQLRTAIAVFDENTSLVFYNAAFEQLWGLDGKWLNNKPKITEFLDKLRENRKLPEQANFKQFKQDWLDRFKDLIDPHEEMMVLPDGAMLRMVLVPQPSGGLLTTFEDVTSRYELETSYNTLVAVQQETLDNLAEGLAVIGEDGRLKLHNPAFVKLWHITDEDIEGGIHVNQVFEKTKKLFKVEDWEKKKNELTQMCFNREGKSGRIKLKDGRIYAYRTVALPDGNVLVSYADITNSVQVEHALKEKNAALQAAEKLKTDFLANVSYQLRTPLNAMMGFTEILHEEYFGKLNDRQKGYTENMIQAGHRLITLVDNILDLSTIEAGYMTLNKESLSVKEALSSVIELTQDWARREGIEIEVKCPKNIGSLIADERRFKQVLLHLIRNAIDYTASGGTIKLTGKRTKDAITVTVQDSGVGIPENDLARIFDPFEKGDNKDKKPTPTNRHSGAGLGLSLVKHIVELHGGAVNIDSKEGKGTTVTCEYPLSANENA